MGATRGMLNGANMGGGGGGGQLRQMEGKAEGVESGRDEGRRGLCLHRELSKDNPSTSVWWVQ